MYYRVGGQGLVSSFKDHSSVSCEGCVFLSSFGKGSEMKIITELDIGFGTFFGAHLETAEQIFLKLLPIHLQTNSS